MVRLISPSQTTTLVPAIKIEVIEFPGGDASHAKVYVALLAFQVQSAGHDGSSEMRHIGTILGWLAAFFEQEQGQLAGTLEVHAPNTETDEQETESVEEKHRTEKGGKNDASGGTACDR